MTLSRWLRDYLYIPLGGNRGGPREDLPQPDDHDAARRALARRRLDVRDLGRHPRHARCSAERLARERFPGFRLPAWLAWLITFHVVCLAWIFFRSPDLPTAFDMIGQLFAGGPSPLVTLPMVLPGGRHGRPPGRGGDFWQRAEAWLVARPVVVQGVASAW